MPSLEKRTELYKVLHSIHDRVERVITEHREPMQVGLVTLEGSGILKALYVAMRDRLDADFADCYIAIPTNPYGPSAWVLMGPVVENMTDELGRALRHNAVLHDPSQTAQSWCTLDFGMAIDVVEGLNASRATRLALEGGSWGGPAGMDVYGYVYKEQSEQHWLDATVIRHLCGFISSKPGLGGRLVSYMQDVIAKEEGYAESTDEEGS